MVRKGTPAYLSKGEVSIQIIAMKVLFFNSAHNLSNAGLKVSFVCVVHKEPFINYVTFRGGRGVGRNVTCRDVGEGGVDRM